MAYDEGLICSFIMCAALFGAAAWFYLMYARYRDEKRYLVYKMELLLNHDYESFKQVNEAEMKAFVEKWGKRE